MFKFLIILIIAMITYGFWCYWHWSFNPAKSKAIVQNIKERAKNTERSIDPVDNEGIKLRSSISDIFCSLPIIGLSESQYVYLATLIDMLEWSPYNQTKPEDIYFLQIVYGATALIGGVALSFIFKPLILIAFFSVIAFKRPVSKLKEIASSEAMEIKFQFPDFYNAIYSRYKEEDISNIVFADVISAYIPAATPAMKKLLRRFSMDVDKGDEIALAELAVRYPSLSCVQRFSTIMTQRLMEEEGSLIAMKTFQEDLQNEVNEWMTDDLNHRQKLVNRATMIMVAAIMTCIFSVYFIVLLKTG